jgi:Flp pilus assembly pilin Flp
MTNKTALVPARKSNKTLLALVRDNRGAELVQMIIVLVCLALAGIGAVKALSGKISKSTNDAGDRVEKEIK